MRRSSCDRSFGFGDVSWVALALLALSLSRCEFAAWVASARPALAARRRATRPLPLTAEGHGGLPRVELARATNARLQRCLRFMIPCPLMGLADDDDAKCHTPPPARDLSTS